MRKWTPAVRGDVFRYRAPKDVHGHEQGGTRYVVVVQSDDLPLSTWLVAPTSTGRLEALFRPEVTIAGARTRVLAERVSAVNPETRLGERVGRLTAAEMQAVDRALAIALGLL